MTKTDMIIAINEAYDDTCYIANGRVRIEITRDLESIEYDLITNGISPDELEAELEQVQLSIEEWSA